MDSPRAQAEEMPATNTASSAAETTPASRVARPATSSRPRAISTNGSAAPITLATSYGITWYALTARPEAARSVTFDAPAASQTAASPSRTAVPSQGRTAGQWPSRARGMSKVTPTEGTHQG